MTQSTPNTQIAHEPADVSVVDARTRDWSYETTGKRRAREQLLAQAPGLQVALADAREALPGELRQAAEDGGLHVFQFPAGAGKSFRTAAFSAERARVGLSTGYVAPNHAIASQTFALLPDDVRKRAVHLHSPLVQVGDGPVCARAADLQDRVFKLGANQQQICRKCPLRESCAARVAHEEREERKKTALIVFTSHAGIDQAIDPDVPDRVLLVDEMPSVFEKLSVGREELETLAWRPTVLAGIPLTQRSTVSRLAKHWLGDETIDAEDLASEVSNLKGRLHLDNPDRALTAVQLKWLGAASDMLRIARADVEVEKLSSGGVQAMLPTDAYRGLLDGYAARILLSATPMLAALPGAKVHACQVRDACPWHERTMRYRADRGKTALEDALKGGSIWADLKLYVDHLRAAASGGGILLVTFKFLEDALRNEPERIGGLEGIHLGHYGAMHGLNTYQEDAEGSQRVRVFATFGDPWLASIGTLQALGLSAGASVDEARKVAAGELYQAHERARAVFARWPVRFFHEGAVAPAGWHTGNATMETLQDAGQAATDAFLDAVLWGRSSETIATACGVSQAAVKMWKQRGSAPSEHELALRELRPSIGEQLTLLRVRAPASAGSYRVRQRLERDAAERRSDIAYRRAQLPDGWEELMAELDASVLARHEYLEALESAP